MAFVVLKPINVYPKGEVQPGALLNREDFPLGTNIEGFVKRGYLRPDSEIAIPMADTDAEGWKQLAERLQAQLDEVKSNVESADVVAEAEANKKELARVQGVYDALRTQYEQAKQDLTKLRNENTGLKKQIKDLGGKVS